MAIINQTNVNVANITEVNPKIGKTRFKKKFSIIWLNKKLHKSLKYFLQQNKKQNHTEVVICSITCTFLGVL